jgi:hypothetical protein
MLSPLRFHYDSDAFALPIRLGLINSGGTQDLVVTILAPGQRYEAANYDNVAIPTNIDVADSTRDQFATFYAKLFDDTAKKHPRSVVTEYAWSAYSCDPCPTPPLSAADLQTLGADALPGATPPPPPGGGAPLVPMRSLPPSGNFVVTRLHARYSKEALGDDLVFRAAPPIVGGREFLQTDGKLEQGARPDGTNNFQARYAIRHPWTGPIACSHPQRGVWGGRPDSWGGATAPPVRPAAKIAFAPRAGNVTLAAFVRGGLPPETFLSGGGAAPPLLVNQTPPLDASAPAQTAVDASPDNGVADAEAAAPTDAAPPPLPPTAPAARGGCAGCATSPPASATTGASLATLLAIAAARLRRRKG